MELLKFEKEYRVNVYETGPRGKLSLYSLFNYMQDIASDHAEILGFGRDDLMKDNHFWVLSRIYAEVSEWPSWEDSIIIRTWPNGTDKLFAFRNFEIMSPEGKKIGNASSSWLILDRDTKKIQRPEVITARLNLPFSDESPVRNPVKLDSAVEQGETSFCFRIKTSDLDINLHTNNTAYLRWVSDNYDFGFIMKNDPSSVEINYLAESKHNEEISIRTTAESCNTFAHSIFRLNDGKELCRLKIIWKEH